MHISPGAREPRVTRRGHNAHLQLQSLSSRPVLVRGSGLVPSVCPGVDLIIRLPLPAARAPPSAGRPPLCRVCSGPSALLGSAHAPSFTVARAEKPSWPCAQCSVAPCVWEPHSGRLVSTACFLLMGCTALRVPQGGIDTASRRPGHLPLPAPRPAARQAAQCCPDSCPHHSRRVSPGPWRPFQREAVSAQRPRALLLATAPCLSFLVCERLPHRTGARSAEAAG